MVYEVRETPEAKRVYEKALKGVARKRYEAFLADLSAQGCKAGGKRLRVRGDEVSRYCARGFYGRWRAHLVFEDAKTIVVFAIMEHTESSNPKRAITEVCRRCRPSASSAPSSRHAARTSTILLRRSTRPRST